jgi:predicted alpha/beta superfamily hydrolase
MSFPTTLKEEKKKFPTTGGSANFISFLEREMIPYIQKQYKTNGSRTLIGESFAGLLAAEILLKKPQLFNRYIIVSPSLWWDNGSLLKASIKLSTTNPATPTDVYIGVGKEGLAPSPDPHVMEVDANVIVDRIRELHNGNINLQFEYLPDEDHGTIDHQAVLNAFKKLQPKK